MSGMQKARKYDIGNTNIAGLGTDLEKAVRQAASEGEPAWTGAGQKVGVKIWRIEKFNVVAWPQKEFGKFFSGDSYIILNTYRRRNGEGAMAWDVHFWIGQESSQDEYGTAAYKTVELDDFLGGQATQYREVQGGESRRFKALFRNMIIMDGGVDTGFRHVKPKEYRHRLLHIKGKLNTVALEVPLAGDSVNEGDSFLLDCGLELHVWHGKEAGIMEKNKAANLAQALTDERGGMPARFVYDSFSNDDREFWQAMGISKPGTIKSKEEGGDDAKAKVTTKKLMKVSDESGELKMTEVASGDSIRRDALSSADVFIFDDGYEVMVWVGRNANYDERKKALNFAAEYLKNEGKPMETPISKLLEGGENEMFEAAFEVGVKSGKDGSAEAGRSKAVASSATANYAGSGGPGVAVDFDALYAQAGVDPDAWGGRGNAPSLYAIELESRKLGAYNPASGWVSGQSARQRQLKAARIAELEEQRKSSFVARAASGASQLGTVKPYTNFNPEADAQALRKAMKGIGTNEKTLIKVLCKRTLDQRRTIVQQYNTLFDRELDADLGGESSGDFKTTMVALALTEEERAAMFLRKSVKGLGTDERLMIDVVCTKEADEIAKIVDAYDSRYTDRHLANDVVADTSGDFKKLILEILKCNRADFASPVDQEAAKTDAKALYDAGEKKWGTNEGKFIEILSTRSFPHLRATVHAYEDISKKTLLKALKSELSGAFKHACCAIVEHAIDSTNYAAKRLYETMKGWGTKDRALINMIIEHAEMDMDLIKERFPNVVAEATDKGKPVYLQDMIAGDTSGSYKRALLTLIGEK